jgi:hypothetical protein
MDPPLCQAFFLRRIYNLFESIWNDWNVHPKVSDRKTNHNLDIPQEPVCKISWLLHFHTFNVLVVDVKQSHKRITNPWAPQRANQRLFEFSTFTATVRLLGGSGMDVQCVQCAQCVQLASPWNSKDVANDQNQTEVSYAPTSIWDGVLQWLTGDGRNV